MKREHDIGEGDHIVWLISSGPSEILTFCLRTRRWIRLQVVCIDQQILGNTLRVISGGGNELRGLLGLSPVKVPVVRR